MENEAKPFSVEWVSRCDPTYVITCAFSKGNGYWMPKCTTLEQATKLARWLNALWEKGETQDRP